MTNHPIRGFDNLIGEKIVKIDATAINSVTFLCKSGKQVVVHGDKHHYGIAILEAELEYV